MSSIRLPVRELIRDSRILQLANAVDQLITVEKHGCLDAGDEELVWKVFSAVE